MIDIFDSKSIGNNTPPNVPHVSDLAEAKFLRMGPTRAIKGKFLRIVAKAGPFVFLAPTGIDLADGNFEAAQADLENNRISRFQWIQVWPKFYPDMEEVNE